MKKEKAIWLFAGGNMQIIAAKKIKNKGFKLILTDRDPTCACKKYVDEFVEADTFDINENLKKASYLQNVYDIKGVLTVAADCHETVNRIADFLNLPGINPKISTICRYKILTREKLTEQGLYQPKYAKISNLSDFKKAIKKIGFPAALKSSDNSGSRGFLKITSENDVSEKNLKYSLKFGTTGYAILEELLIPVKNEIAELSVETIWQNGKMYWLNWVDRLFRNDFELFNIEERFFKGVNWGVEIGHINPALHSIETKKNLEDIIYKAGIAIGMHTQKHPQILKADIMLTEQGPCILELTPRLSGGWDSSKTTPLRGGDFVGGVLELACGKRLDLDLWYKYFTYKYSNLFAAIISKPKPDAKDCIGRVYGVGNSLYRDIAVKNALKNLLEGNYVVE